MCVCVRVGEEFIKVVGYADTLVKIIAQLTLIVSNIFRRTALLLLILLLLLLLLLFSGCNRTYYGDIGQTYALELHRPKQDRVPFVCVLTFTAAGGQHGDVVQVSNPSQPIPPAAAPAAAPFHNSFRKWAKPCHYKDKASAKVAAATTTTRTT